MQNIHDLDTLRGHFVNSVEFISKHSDFLGPKSNIPIHEQIFPNLHVETEYTEEVISTLFNMVKANWIQLGKSDPYWSVVSQPQFKGMQSSNKSFYESGEYNAKVFISKIKKNYVGDLRNKTCIDFGCGVGRVSKFLAPYFHRLDCIDISKSHLDIARSFLTQTETNINFLELDNYDIDNKIENIDFLYSILTLQHNPPPLALFLLRSLLGKLNSGGIAYIQLPSYIDGYLFGTSRYMADDTKNSIEMHLIPQDIIFKTISDCNCLCLEIREDGLVGSSYNTISNNYLIRKS
jgi:SAM-dependent methyltransferase